MLANHRGRVDSVSLYHSEVYGSNPTQACHFDVNFNFIVHVNPIVPETIAVVNDLVVKGT